MSVKPKKVPSNGFSGKSVAVEESEEFLGVSYQTILIKALVASWMTWWQQESGGALSTIMDRYQSQMRAMYLQLGLTAIPQSASWSPTGIRERGVKRKTKALKLSINSLPFQQLVTAMELSLHRKSLLMIIMTRLNYMVCGVCIHIVIVILVTQVRPIIVSTC